MPQSAPALFGLVLFALALPACTGTLGENGVQLEHTQTGREDRAERRQQPPRTTAPAEPATRPRITGGRQPSRQIPNPPWVTTAFGTFNEPWAMTFLPDGRVLITEKSGQLRLYNTATRTTGTVTGVPTVAYGGQGGFGDVILHPQFASNRYVYFSYIESEGGNRGAVVARAQLTLDANGGGSLGTPQIVWRQTPKMSGQGHFSHRLLFDRDGKLWITSGDRQAFSPAQNMSGNLGKLVRLNDDGSVPSDNPFFSQGGVAAQVWSLGHRNPLGIAMDATGRIWTHEMGPQFGDEVNLIERGSNYGWPNVSNGNHYDGVNIPDHAPGDGYNAPEVSWSGTTIAPAGFIIYSGDLFPWFRGDGFIGGLASQALVRIRIEGNTAREVDRYSMGRRIREVEQGPDGAIWVLEDGSSGRLVRLTPAPM
jgi:glucose/arabinose dehydrogenase